MYNRYIPDTYTWTQPEAPPARGEEQKPSDGPRLPDFFRGKDGRSLLDFGKDGLSGLLKGLHLEKLDSGDILLALILLYLLVEGEDMDLVIALALVLLLGLGE